MTQSYKFHEAKKVSVDPRALKELKKFSNDVFLNSWHYLNC